MEKLPVELMQGICAALCPHCPWPNSVPRVRSTSKMALVNLSRTSSWCRAVAQPFLFHNFATADVFATWGHRRITTCNGALAFFARSLADRPDLASHIRVLHLAGNGSGIASHDERVRAALADIASRTDADTGYSSPDLAHYQEYDRLARMALSSCPNLRTLTLVRWTKFSVFDGLGIGSLPALTRLYLNSDEETAHFHIVEAAVLFTAAPNLEVLHASGCGGFFPESPSNPDGPSRPAGREPFDLRLGNLQTLVIRRLEFGDVQRLLPACPQLQNLVYKPPRHPDGSPKPGPLHVLRPVRKTLRSLDLKTDAWSEREDSTRSRIPMPIQSFRNLLALQALTVDYSAVHRPGDPAACSVPLLDWLPPSIEHVFFRHLPRVQEPKTVQFLDYLRGLASEAPKHLPRLRSIRVSFKLLDGVCSIFCSDWRPFLSRVEAEFKQAGITFYRADPWTGTRVPELQGTGSRETGVTTEVAENTMTLNDIPVVGEPVDQAAAGPVTNT